MKNLKLMALAAMLCLGTVNVAAQDEEELDESFIFVDEEGNKIADGRQAAPFHRKSITG